MVSIMLITVCPSHNMRSHNLSFFQCLSRERSKVSELVTTQQRLEREKFMAEAVLKKKEDETNVIVKQLQDLHSGAVSENKKLLLKVDLNTKEITGLKEKYSSAVATIR